MRRLLFLFLFVSPAFGSVIINPGGGSGSGDIEGVTAGYGLSGGGTSGSVTVNLESGVTDYIQNRDSLQSGATFYVSSATVRGQFSVSDDDTIARIDTNLSSVASSGIGPQVLARTVEGIGTQGYFRIAVTTRTAHQDTESVGQTEFKMAGPLNGGDGQLWLLIDGETVWLADNDHVEVDVPLALRLQSGLRLGSANAQYVQLRASATLSDYSTYWLPESTGTAGQVLRIKSHQSDHVDTEWATVSGSGDNLGNHVASTTLNMAGFPVVSVSTISVSTTIINGITYYWPASTPTNGTFPRYNTGGTLTFSTVSTESPSAIPTINVYDSDATDGDINAHIQWNCSDASSGSEDCDMFFNQQIAGTLTRSMTFDADGNITSSKTIVIAGQNEIRLEDSDSSNYVAFKSSAAMSGNIGFIMPVSTTAATTGGNLEIASISGTSVVLEFGTDGGGGGATERNAYFSASAGLCQITLGCADPDQYETATTSTSYIAATFTSGTTLYWQINFTLPEDYEDGTTFTAVMEWTSTATATVASWTVDMKAVGNDDTLDGSWGTGVSVADTTTAVGDLMRTAETTAITAANSPVSGDRLFIRVYRGNIGDARFAGIQLKYQLD